MALLCCNHLPQAVVGLLIFLVWNFTIDFELKYDFGKNGFQSQNINGQPFRIQLTAYFPFIRHVEVHQTSNLIDLVMCAFAPHPPVNKQHIM
jgi:hypothetical protein